MMGRAGAAEQGGWDLGYPRSERGGRILENNARSVTYGQKGRV